MFKHNLGGAAQSSNTSSGSGIDGASLPTYENNDEAIADGLTPIEDFYTTSEGDIRMAVPALLHQLSYIINFGNLARIGGFNTFDNSHFGSSGYGSPQGLLSLTGNDSGAAISFKSSTSASNTFANQDSGRSGYTTYWTNELLNDLVTLDYIGAGDGAVISLKFTGFAPLTTYNIGIIGSRNVTTGPRTTIVSGFDNAATMTYDAIANPSVAYHELVTTGATGEFELTFNYGNGDFPYTYLNGMSIDQV